jgi:Domain of Unknown Function (DUF1543)
MKLFMLLLGATPPGRYTEQHDIFFGIANTLKDLVPEIISAWPEAKNKIHIDAWREVKLVDGFRVTITEKVAPVAVNAASPKLFFINLGGYKQNEFDEFHYKMLIAAENKSIAIQRAKQSAFYKHTGFKGAESHIDDKYGVDVDDVYQIEDILAENIKEKYSVQLSPADNEVEDALNLGYFRLEKL